MRLPRLILVLTLALGGLSCSHVILSERPLVSTAWPHATSDLQPDPAVTWGHLPNGLRYAILPHATPPQRVSAFLLVQTGSYHERNHELGYAHFVEHLAFRTLRGVPDGVFATLEKLGASTSPHSNGVTGPFETQYRLDDLPAHDPAALPASLAILRAIADGIVFDEEGVARERKVIFNERLTHNAMMASARADELEFLPPRNTDLHGNELASLFSSSRVARRAPFGTTETLEAATAARLRTFYERWYRPERMVLAIAGDVAPAEVEALVRRNFESLAPRGRAAAEPPIELPKPRSELHGTAHDWKTEPFSRVALGVVRPHFAPDTLERRRGFLARRLSLSMLERRYQRTANGENPPFLSARPVLSHYVPGAELLILRASASPLQWPKAVEALDFEPRRIWVQGFAPTEFQRAVQAEINRTTAAARHATLRSSGNLAQALAFSVARGVVFTSPEYDREITAAQLRSLTAEECRDHFAALLGSDEFAFAIAGPFPAAAPKPDAAGQALYASRTAPLPEYAPPPAIRPFPYTDFGPPGKIVKSDHSVSLDAQLIEFANGVRLNLKRTTFDPGRVSVAFRLDGGRQSVPAHLPGLEMKLFAWMLGGVRDLSLEELGASLTELTGQPQLSLSSSEFRLTQRESATNLPLLFQVATAHFVRPGLHPNPGAAQLADQLVAPLQVTAGGVSEWALRQRVMGDHPAVRAPSLAQVQQRTVEELKPWLISLLNEAPLEIGIVGDFESTVVIDAVASTFGALPPRPTTRPRSPLGTMPQPAKPFADTRTFNGNKGLAAVSLLWPVPVNDYPSRFRAQIIAKILEQRLWQRFRVDAGEAYIVHASFQTTNETFDPACDFLQCRVEGAPDRADHLATLAREVAATLARDGATADEFERARRPLLGDTQSGMRNNDWLLDIIAVAQSNPLYAEQWARATAEFQSATVAEINAALRHWLSPDRTSQMIVKPDES